MGADRRGRRANVTLGSRASRATPRASRKGIRPTLKPLPRPRRTSAIIGATGTGSPRPGEPSTDGGQFSLDGNIYTLDQNNGPNSLHGGFLGFDKRVWDASPIEESDRVGVELTRTSEEGEGCVIPPSPTSCTGYPGNLEVTVTYTLDRHNNLEMKYTATTDAPTVVNLTNHAYWNLAGEGTGTINDHKLTLNAPAFTPVDETLTPTGEIRPRDRHAVRLHDAARDRRANPRDGPATAVRQGLRPQLGARPGRQKTRAVRGPARCTTRGVAAR